MSTMSNTIKNVRSQLRTTKRSIVKPVEHKPKVVQALPPQPPVIAPSTFTSTQKIAMTEGEFERDVSAPEPATTVNSGGRQRTERTSSGNKGVPIWIRQLRNPQRVATQEKTASFMAGVQSAFNY